MKMRATLTALSFTVLLSGCSTLLDTFTLNDAQVKEMSDEACAQMDADAKIAPANSKYTKRLNKIAANLGNQANGVPLNYKVYQTTEINAWAMANGCVRVYSGLMDKMTDDEVQGVLGHEIGHVAKGHSKKAMQTAYATTMARDAIGTYGGDKAAELTQTQWADLGENLINAQFSQYQETEADDFSYELLKSKNLNTKALASAFDKLGEGGGAGNGLNQMFSSHPDSKNRAARVREKIASGQ